MTKQFQAVHFKGFSLTLKEQSGKVRTQMRLLYISNSNYFKFCNQSSAQNYFSLFIKGSERVLQAKNRGWKSRDTDPLKIRSEVK